MMLSFSEALARSMFTAEYGHTGLSWDSMSEMSHDEWRQKAGRVCEHFYNPKRPILVIDLQEDQYEFRS